MKRLILMMQFLTKLPLAFEIKADKEDFSKGIIYFPFIGLLIGLMLYGLHLVFSVFFSSFVTAILLVTFEVFITGGLHLDGLADSFDGLYSYRDKKRMLEIMKDSRIGVNGVLVLIISILLKIGLIYTLSQETLFILILMPLTSRYLAVVLATFSKYARQEGMGGFFIGETSIGQLLIASISLFAYALLAKGLIILLVLLIFTFIFRSHVYHKIDGLTGDILGAWIEMSEVIMLILVGVIL